MALLTGQGNGPRIGPSLTHYEPHPAFVRAWLRDPAAYRDAALTYVVWVEP